MKEEQESNRESDHGNENFALAELAPEQYAVTPVPKFTTELPFFYLTKKKELLQQDIHYEGVDAYGNPIRWEVIPNRSPRIGVPSIEAHSIFTQLIKPVMEMHRQLDGQIPEIIPLGGIRECLRMIGWKAGGWEARRLLRGLMQIGQATCDFDFLLPTGETDGEGKPLFKTIKGIFTRFSIWKIGSTHVSEEELATGNFNFDFDLADTVYLQLHKVERDIQRTQDQRYLDNTYMFSVEARARRWYELLAAKIFGVVKNNGSYCEVRYSWYIKHHHTLMRCNSRGRAVGQMNRIVKDHMMSGFVNRVEYRTLTDDSGQLDLLMRYYPGPAAKGSLKRILSFLNTSTFPALVARRKTRSLKFQPVAETEARRNSNNDAKVIALREEVIEASESVTTASKILDALLQRNVVRRVALSLLADRSREQLEKIEGLVEYWDSLRYEKGAGLLVNFIQNDDPLPPGFETKRHRAERLAAEKSEKREAQAEETLTRRYDDFCRDFITKAIAGLPSGDFERRVSEYKSGLLKKPGLWNERPEMADQLARHAVRAAIAEMVNVPTYADFKRWELSGLPAEIKLSEQELSIPSIPAETGIAPDALYGPPANDLPPNRDFPNSEENSSPRSI